MDTDQNLLFGVLALQAGLIDSRQFVDACAAWIACKDTPLVDVLVERGWLLEADKAHLEYLLERKLRKDRGDAKVGLAAVADDVKRSLAALNDPEIQQSLGGLSVRDKPAIEETTIFCVSESDERYELTGLHATGGIGRIWMAHDRVLGRTVALKELRPERAGDASLSMRFLQEARITGQLEHPGVVPVYELGQRPDNREPFYTMRFVHGRTLAKAAYEYHERRAREPVETFDLHTLLNAFVTVCNTVAYSHSRGIVHRDLKGQNVVLGDFGEVVVLDWGLAKQLSRTLVEGQGQIISSDVEPENVNLTLDGEAVGTPAYMAPEQAAGRIDLIDHRTDVYGLGAILYEILTGEPPFSGADTKDVLRKVQYQEPVPPSGLNNEVPDLLEAACLKALAKEPCDRHASASDLAQQVERWQEVQRRQAEQALRDSEALYRSLVDILPLSLVRKDLENRFTFANNRACQSIGKPLEEIVGKTDFDLFPAELAELSQQGDNRVLKTGKTTEFPPFLYIDKGEERYFQSIKSPIYDSRGKIIGTQTVIWDVSELKRAERALRDSEALYRSLVDHLPIYVTRKDLEGRLTFVNRAMCEWVGMTWDELVGKTDYDLWPPEFADKYRRDDRHVATTGDVFHCFEENLSRDRLSYVEVWKVPIRDAAGEMVGTQVVFWDETERKRLEDALKKVTAQLTEAKRQLKELKPERE